MDKHTQIREKNKHSQFKLWKFKHTRLVRSNKKNDFSSSPLVANTNMSKYFQQFSLIDTDRIL